ncbi:MAG: DUF177 domain-containing protein [Deltaproteobacteria bacterium]|nr:DUF177 domain-containing protein [Deltaproteobacteria bacterium]
MFVLIEEIRDGGLALDRELGEEYLARVLSEGGPETGFAPAGAARLKARFDRVGDKILLRGDVAVSVKGACKRCLIDVTIEVPVHFELNLVARKPEGSEREELEGGEVVQDADSIAESADEESYDGRQIDLGAIVREQILLALPMDGLCREDCKGLCSVCGQDLNVKECGCQRKVADPRWAALKDIKLT